MRPVLKGCIYMNDAIIAGHLEALASMSQKYGSDPDYVLAGGGNTSYKTADTLYVKGSGTSLAAIKPDDFVVMSRERLDSIWGKTYPDDDDAREAAVLADMMAARAEGESRRPSVEALLHSLFPFPFVLHVHPALVNGMTCGADGERICAELFPDSVWIPEVKPGYTLAALCRRVCAGYGKAHGGEFPRLMFLQNHGVFFAGVNPSEIDELVERVMGALRARIAAEPDFTELRDETDGFKDSDAAAIAVELRYRYGLCVVFSRSRALLEYDPTTKPLTPDHIVYTRAWPLVAAAGSLAREYDSYISGHGCVPRIVFSCIDPSADRWI